MRTQLVIGGSSGIGESVVDLLKEAGDAVYATYNNNSSNRIQGVEYSQLDVVNSELDEEFLPDSIDGLVYCPGSINLKPFHRFSEDDFINDFRLQVTGALKVIKAILPKLKKGNHPSIVLFSSVAVQTGFPFHAQVAASKGAVEGIVRALAAEFAPTIRVNAIAPSITQTPLASALLNTEKKIEINKDRHPLKKIGEPIDIAKMVQFLLSEDSKWMTGQIVKVDGGISSIK